METEATDQYDLVQSRIVRQSWILRALRHQCRLLLRPRGTVPEPSVLTNGVNKAPLRIVVAAEQDCDTACRVENHTCCLPPGRRCKWTGLLPVSAVPNPSVVVILDPFSTNRIG